MKQYKINALYIISLFSIVVWLMLFLGTLRPASHYILIITVTSFLIAVLNRETKGVPDFKRCPPPPPSPGKIVIKMEDLQGYITFLENECDLLKEENKRLKNKP